MRQPLSSVGEILLEIQPAIVPPSMIVDLWRSYEVAIDSIDLYVDSGIDPGDQLTAMLENDLREAFGRADEFRRVLMFPILCYLWNEIPALCWGSPQRMTEWRKLLAEKQP